MLQKKEISHLPERIEETHPPEDKIIIVINYKTYDFPLNRKPISIGQNASCNCQIEDNRLYDHHMQIKYVNDKIIITDLTGHNKISVNHKSLDENDEHFLEIDDLISLTSDGPFFQFHDGNQLIYESSLDQEKPQKKITEIVIPDQLPDDIVQKNLNRDLVKTIAVISIVFFILFLIIVIFNIKLE